MSGFCLEGDGEPAERQDAMHFARFTWQLCLGGIERENGSLFYFFPKFAAPSIFKQRFVSGTSNQQELPHCLWSLFMPGVDPAAPSEVIPSTDDLG